MTQEELKLECIGKAIQIAPNMKNTEIITGIQYFNSNKDPQAVLDIANIFYHWIKYQ